MSTATASLSEVVSQARSAAGMTQEQFAVMAGITAKTLRAIESGADEHRPQKRTLRGLARALGVEYESLLAHSGEAVTASTRHGKRNPHPSAEHDLAVTRGAAGAAPEG